MPDTCGVLQAAPPWVVFEKMIGTKGPFLLKLKFEFEFE